MTLTVGTMIDRRVFWAVGFFIALFVLFVLLFRRWQFP